MPKTPKPLTVWVSRELEHEPTIQDLVVKGNTVRVLDDEPDLIFSRTAWRVIPGLEKYMPMALAAARKTKYGKPLKGESDG